jgi:hydroxyacylglutathione hydrolase
MTLRFEQILADGIAQTSYVVGDDAAGVAAVVDPRPDIEVYLRYAQGYGLAITHVFETHVHADFMSGARELAARLGGAETCVSREGGAAYGFEHRGIGNGERFEFGSAVLTARFTPGHTPEHLAYLVAE